MKIAVPIDYGQVSSHFGRATDFVIVHVENQQVKKREFFEPPPHEPSVLPQWLHELSVEVVIARGMGKGARELFGENGIEVVTGVLGGGPEQLVQQYLTNTLVTGHNTCDH
jgi:predicted Fe-Mo cluster-binding NifX family protein